MRRAAEPLGRSEPHQLGGPMAARWPATASLQGPAAGPSGIASLLRHQAGWQTLRHSAVTAAVVGVILNLAVWFGVHVIFRETVAWQGYGLNVSLPVLPSLDLFSAILAIAAALALFRFKIGVIQTLLACSLAGVVLHLAFGAAL